NIRRDAHGHRQLALVRRAVLCAHWKASFPAAVGNRHSLQASAVLRLQGYASRELTPELAGAWHRARREHLAAIRSKAARSRHGARGGEDAFLLRRLVPERTECRLRNAAP